MGTGIAPYLIIHIGGKIHGVPLKYCSINSEVISQTLIRFTDGIPNIWLSISGQQRVIINPNNLNLKMWEKTTLEREANQRIMLQN